MKLTHLNNQGDIKQVPVQKKAVMEREATATGFIHLSQLALKMVKEGILVKGNVLAAARLAGIQAAKKTADLVPLCHPLLLEEVSLDFNVQATGIEVLATVIASAKTGVEMEALTAVCIALLTIYDMVKAVDKKMSFSNIRLIKKIKR